MPVRSLFDLATATCVKNLKGLESIGDFLPYEAVRPILLKIDSAYQLRQIELNSPQIQGATGEIWLKLVEKDFPLEYKSKAYKPQNPDSWYRVWEKYKKGHDAAIRESEAKLKNALAGLREDKEKNTSRIIERKLLPASARLGRGRKPYGGASRDACSNSMTFNAGSRTKMNNGASVMRKVRREVKEIATIHGALSKCIGGPERLSRLAKAPAAMVNDHRRASQPRYRRSALLSPEPPSAAVAEHEARASFISDSEENLGDDDDVLGDEMPKAPSKPTGRPVVRALSACAAKKKPGASGQAPPPSSAKTAKPASAAPSPQKRGSSGLLSNKFRPGAGKVVSKPSPSGLPDTKIVAARPAPQPEAAKMRPCAARAQASPSSSPPPAAAPPAEPTPALIPSTEGVPRKRKAVDIFMRRPNKRVV